MWKVENAILHAATPAPMPGRVFRAKFRKDWEIVRQVAEASGDAFNCAHYDKRSTREAEAAAKKATEAKQP